LTTHTVRLKKEVHHLLWPSIALTCLGLYGFFSHQVEIYGLLRPEWLIQFAIFGGIPVLASLGLGMEFQYHTLGMSLAQPVERREIWFAKFSVMIFAVLPPLLLFVLDERLSLGFDHDRWLLIIGWLMVTVMSAFLWTMIAHSTIGGFALNAGANGILFMSLNLGADYLRQHDLPALSVTVVIAAIVIVYAAVMGFLGRRMFVSYQAVSGMQVGEASLPGAGLIPAFVSDWLRCRPNTPILNLVRREFRLLRLVWPLTLLSVACWTCLVTFRVIPVDPAHDYRSLPLIALTVMISILIALLCGSLSLGEEKSWGTHDWQLTLPAPPSLQWFVKLAIAMFISLFCGALLPMGVLLAAQSTAGMGHAFLPIDFMWMWFAVMAIITLAAFWSACLVKGTVRAALLAFPVCMVIFAAGELGQWLASNIQLLFPFPFSGIIQWMGPMRAGAVSRVLDAYRWDEKVLFGGAGAVLVGIALVQSHRLFRSQNSDSPRQIVRSLVPMFLSLFIASFALAMSFYFAWNTRDLKVRMQREIGLAIEHASLVGNGSSRPLQITGDQLSAGLPLSPNSKQWLSGATAIIAREDVRVDIWGAWLNWTPQMRPYSAVLKLRDGSSCYLALHQIPKNPKYGSLMFQCD
jgi:hypothetical protein